MHFLFEVKKLKIYRGSTNYNTKIEWNFDDYQISSCIQWFLAKPTW